MVNIKVNSTADVGRGQTPAFLIGNRTSHHIAIDNNEIGSFNNNANSVLYINGSQSTSNTIINGDGTGNVGIGTSNPTSKLTVNGSLTANGNITFQRDSEIRLAPFWRSRTHSIIKNGWRHNQDYTSIHAAGRTDATPHKAG